MPEVIVEDVGALNLVALMIREIINKNLQNPNKLKLTKRLNCTLVLKASRMSMTVIFKNGEVFLRNGASPKPTVYIEADLGEFLNIGVGGSYIIPLITGKLKIRGIRLWKLLPILKLIRI